MYNYTFFKSEFLRNEHGETPPPPFFFLLFQSTRDMMSFVCAKFKKNLSAGRICYIRPKDCLFKMCTSLPK